MEKTDQLGNCSIPQYCDWLNHDSALCRKCSRSVGRNGHNAPVPKTGERQKRSESSNPSHSAVDCPLCGKAMFYDEDRVVWCCNNKSAHPGNRLIINYTPVETGNQKVKRDKFQVNLEKVSSYSFYS